MPNFQKYSEQIRISPTIYCKIAKSEYRNQARYEYRCVSVCLCLFGCTRLYSLNSFNLELMLESDGIHYSAQCFIMN